MFDKNTIESYKNIKAPQELKNIVLNKCAQAEKQKTVKPSNRRHLMQLAMASACLLVVAAVVFISLNRVDLYNVSVEGKSITQSLMEIPDKTPAMIRSDVISEISIPLEIELSTETEISVYGGEMQVVNPVTEQTTDIGTKFNLSTNVKLFWTVSADTNNMEFKMILKSAEKNSQILVRYDINNAQWTISQKRK